MKLEVAIAIVLAPGLALTAGCMVVRTPTWSLYSLSPFSGRVVQSGSNVTATVGGFKSEALSASVGAAVGAVGAMVAP